VTDERPKTSARKADDLPTLEEVLKGWSRLKKGVEDLAAEFKRNGNALKLLNLQLTEGPEKLDKRQSTMDGMDRAELIRASEAAAAMTAEIRHYLLYRSQKEEIQ
jgi:serine phosphatase RsbU (regulator of sigma subunit)